MIPMTPTRRSARIRGRHGGGSDISETNSDYALRVSQADATKDTDSVLKKSREPDIEEIEISSDSNNENDETVLRSKKRKRESVIPSEVKRTKETGKGKKLSDPFEDENNPDLMDMLQDFVE
ncbi:hypothetical protein HDE_00821 [Halotydeus destructor]|nr:hypothetical protein HDE_00821 [Halotydeus destructor]